MPSRMSRPTPSRQRCSNVSGNASPAEMHIRSRSRGGSSASLEQHRVQRRYTAEERRAVPRENCLDDGRRRTRATVSTTVAPTENGNVSALPRPYAKNNFAAENTTSSAVIPRMLRPYVFAVNSRSPWRWITPFGLPVVPDVYSQNAGSSRRVERRRTCDPTRRKCARRAHDANPIVRRRACRGARRIEHVCQVGQQRRRHDQQLRFAVGDDVRVVLRGQQRVQRHRNGAGAHCAEETHRKVDAVFEAQQHAFAVA